LTQNQVAPVDMLVLYAKNCSVNTEHFNGDTNPKHKKQVLTNDIDIGTLNTKKHKTETESEGLLNNYNYQLSYEEIDDINKDLSLFNGKLSVNQGVDNNITNQTNNINQTNTKTNTYKTNQANTKETINTQYEVNSDHMIFSNSILLSDKDVIAISVFVGYNTRAKIHETFLKQRENKKSTLESSLNKIFLIFMLMLIIQSFISTFCHIYYMKADERKIPLTISRLILIFIIETRNYVPFIPSYLYFVLLLCKYINSRKINNYLNSNDAMLNNCNEIELINPYTQEDLGKTSYIFSDKTGTLTTSEMVFRQFRTQFEKFSYEKHDRITEVLNDEIKELNKSK